MSRYFSFSILLIIIAVLGVFLYRVLAGFIVPVFLAAILVVIFRPTHLWVVEKVRGRQTIAAGLTTVGILLLVLLPVTLLVLLGAYEGRELLKQVGTGSIVDKIDQVRDGLGLTIPAQEALELGATELNTLEEEFAINHRLSDTSYFYLLLAQISDELKYTPAETPLAKTEAPLEDATPEDASLDDLEANADEDAPIRFVANDKYQNALPAWNELISELHETEIASTNLEELSRSDETFKTETTKTGEHLHEVTKKFERFRDTLLGGRLLSKLKFAANPSEEDMRKYEGSIGTWASEKLLTIGGATTAFLVKLLVGLSIMTVSLYFFLIDGPRILESLKGLSPIDDAHEEELIDEFHRVSRAVVVATLLSAIAQGILAGIGYWFVGMDSVFLLTLITTCLALVPFLGAASVWIPVSLYLCFVENQLGYGIGLAVYGFAVVSMVDNFIKPYILHGASNLHPLLALLSVLGGVTALGPIGILVGPMIVAFLQTLLKILQREISTLEFGGAFGDGPAVQLANAGPQPTATPDEATSTANEATANQPTPAPSADEASDQS